MTEAAPRPDDLLSDVTVIQLGDGPRMAYGGRLLADLGADVVVPSRSAPARSSRRVLLDSFLDQGKRMVALPPGGDARSSAIAELTRSASVVLLDLHAAHAAEDLAAIEALAVPQLHVRDRPTSAVGSPPTPELLLQAEAGWIYRRGPVPQPVRVGGRLADFSIGAYVAVGALVALAGVETTAAPTVELCGLEALYNTLPLSRFYRGPQTNPLLDAGPPGIVRCSDGWAGINCLTGQHWEDLCTLLGLEEHMSRLPEIKASEAALAEFRKQIPEWFLDQPATEIVSLCQALRIPSAPVGTGATMPGFEHWVERGSIASTQIDGRSLPSPRPPFRVHGRATGGSRPSSPPSELPDLPFAGRRVLDLGSFWAAPYLTCLLGALGADVVKVEGPRRPDGFRYFGVSPDDGELWYESGAAWQATNLNKRGIALDLTRPEGRELLLRLAEDAEVVIENFSPRVIEQFGLDHAALSERNPRISLMRMPAYGTDGPWRDYVGWAATFEEIGGLAEVTGFPEGPPNIPGGQSDPIAGLHAAVAVLAAMRRAARTGVGYDLEVATSDVMLYLAAEQLLDSADRGISTTRLGNEGADLAAESVTGDDASGWQARVDAPGAQPRVADVISAHALPGRLEEGNTGITTRFPVVGALDGRIFLNWPLHVGGRRVVQHAGPPRLGEHTAVVLAELGLDEPQVVELIENGTVLVGAAGPNAHVRATEARTGQEPARGCSSGRREVDHGGG
ncbi:MAG: Acyl-CoA hydratase [Frankiales bacterium]|nr:Acyl-CoA hydratase [Frankiales bacterium]